MHSTMKFTPKTVPLTWNNDRDHVIGEATVNEDGTATLTIHDEKVLVSLRKNLGPFSIGDASVKQKPEMLYIDGVANEVNALLFPQLQSTRN